METFCSCLNFFNMFTLCLTFYIPPRSVHDLNYLLCCASTLEYWSTSSKPCSVHVKKKEAEAGLLHLSCSFVGTEDKRTFKKVLLKVCFHLKNVTWESKSKNLQKASETLQKRLGRRKWYDAACGIVCCTAENLRTAWLFIFYSSWCYISAERILKALHLGSSVLHLV